MNRRRFFSTLTSAFAAGAAAPALAQQPATAPKIDRLRLDAAESIFGVDFTEAEEQMALNTVNRNLDSFEQLRKLNIPLDTEPAVTFRPYLPGKKPTGRATPGAKVRFTRTTAPDGLTPDQIAFLPVTALAVMIETKKITSTELTKIYLDRLKKHGDTLKCVVTLTEELALKQAADADAEIRAGRYRGPLHGIPWGAKDLLATRGYKTTWGATPYEDQVIDLDATVVERLREAGAVLVAKLVDGRAGAGRRVVRRLDAQPVECRTQLERLVGRSRRGNGGRTGRLSPSAPKRSARSSRRRSPTASRACVRPTAASAATARWRCAGRWTRSGRCAGRSKTACWC